MNNQVLQKILFTFLLTQALFSSGQVDTLSNYSELKNYNGALDSVFINHTRYHGLFFRSDCSVEDHGSKIMTFNNGCWERIFNNFSPRFWALGGRSNDNKIKLVIKEIDAVNSAALAAFDNGGDTVEFDSMIPIDMPINLYSQNTYLGISDSAGFYRVNPPKTLLLSDVEIGDKKIYVQSNAGFRTFQKINIANDQPYDSIAKHVSYTASILTSNDTTIFLSGRSIQKQMKAGDSVSLFFEMMKPGFSDLDDIYLKNLVFYGNRNNYNLNYDWRVNPTINIPTTENSLVENCRFYQIPSENVFICGATIKDCSGISFNGSALHFSCNVNSVITQVLYNKFSDLNHIGDETMEHSEATLTFSAKVQNLRVAYNTLNGSQENGIGQFNLDDFNNEITDNLFSVNKELIRFQPFYDLENLIYNNKDGNSLVEEVDRFILTPSLTDLGSCKGASDLNNFYNIGDTITIVLDTLQVSRSNENFLKCISPIFDDRYFDLVNVSLSTNKLSQYHQWVFQDSELCRGAVFDNGHRNGVFANGNWGYEGCGEVGGCTDITFTFVVSNLPDCESEVSCPLQGIEVYFDGDLTTWGNSPNIPLTPFLLDSDELGSPFLSTIGSASETDYTADFCQGESIEIAGETFSQAGDFQVVLQNSSGCDSLINIELRELPLGNQECTVLSSSSHSETITIYPNPATTHLNYSSSASACKMIIFSITGKREQSFDLKDSSSGTYSIDNVSSGFKLVSIYFTNGRTETTMLYVKK